MLSMVMVLKLVMVLNRLGGPLGLQGQLVDLGGRVKALRPSVFAMKFVVLGKFLLRQVQRRFRLLTRTQQPECVERSHEPVADLEYLCLS